MYLLDTNVLIYAFQTNSIFHKDCYKWLVESITQGECFFIPDLVAVAFLRINTNLKEDPAPLKSCLDFLNSIPSKNPFSEKEEWLQGLSKMAFESLKGNLINDAYLASLARLHKATLVSTDQDFKNFKGLKIFDPTQS